jgi:hypothetical protein
MADIVKYAENKIRTYLGIKSKLTVYSVGVELQRALDKYFEAELFSIPKVSRKKEEVHEYDVLYDLPKIEFSLEKAKQIEKESWSVTNDLISAFDEETSSISVGSTQQPNVVQPIEQIICETKEELNEDQKVDTSPEGSSLREKLFGYIDIVDAIKCGKKNECASIAAKQGLMLESIIDSINEIAVDEIGDILIEETDDGFSIVECYFDII